MLYICPMDLSWVSAIFSIKPSILRHSHVDVLQSTKKILPMRSRAAWKLTRLKQISKPGARDEARRWTRDTESLPFCFGRKYRKRRLAPSCLWEILQENQTVRPCPHSTFQEDIKNNLFYVDFERSDLVMSEVNRPCSLSTTMVERWFTHSLTYLNYW